MATCNQTGGVNTATTNKPCDMCGEFGNTHDRRFHKLDDRIAALEAARREEKRDAKSPGIPDGSQPRPGRHCITATCWQWVDPGETKCGLGHVQEMQAAPPTDKDSLSVPPPQELAPGWVRVPTLACVSCTQHRGERAAYNRTDEPIFACLDCAESAGVFAVETPAKHAYGCDCGKCCKWAEPCVAGETADECGAYRGRLCQCGVECHPVVPPTAKETEKVAPTDEFAIDNRPNRERAVEFFERLRDAGHNLEVLLEDDEDEAAIYGYLADFADEAEARGRASGPARSATDAALEELAKLFHETYERLAPAHGYETRKASAVPWDQVAANNKSLMIATCAEVIGKLRIDRTPSEAVAKWRAMHSSSISFACGELQKLVNAGRDNGISDDDWQMVALMVARAVLEEAAKP